MLEIEPAAPQDMNQRLNDDLACLASRVEALEKALATRPPAEPTAPNRSALVDGLSITIDDVYVAEDKKSLVAQMSLVNTSPDEIGVILVGGESTFVLPRDTASYQVRANAMSNCQGGDGKYWDSRSCSGWPYSG